MLDKPAINMQGGETAARRGNEPVPMGYTRTGRDAANHRCCVTGSSSCGLDRSVATSWRRRTNRAFWPEELERVGGSRVRGGVCVGFVRVRMLRR